MLYIIKSTLILGIILAVYHFFLEKEKMHQFNRFYLLSGLILAFVTPLITVGYIPVPAIQDTLAVITLGDTVPVLEVSQYDNSPISIYQLGLIAYIIGSILFAGRFVFNLFKIIQKTNKNDRVPFHGFTLVLIDNLDIPHSFFNYIFINKHDYESDLIEDQIITHEKTHANQLHSLDILIIELIQVFVWFNPLIYFFKRAIQLNHEFLADEQVVLSHGYITEYQHLLINKASNNKTVYLASSLNFSVTKKRLKMMTKTSNRLRASLYAACTIPLFICLLMSFGNKAYAQSSSSNEELKEKMFQNSTFVWKDSNGTRVYKNYMKLTDKQKALIPLPPPPPPVHGEVGKESISLPIGSVVEYDVASNRLTVSRDGNGIAPPPPPMPPTAPKAIAPPPPPKAPKAPKEQKVLHEKELIKIKEQKVLQEKELIKIKEQKVLQEKELIKLKEQKMLQEKELIKFKEQQRPTPQSDMDLAIMIAKEGGMFSIDGKTVDSDQAIALLKNLDQVATIDIIKRGDKKLMKLRTKK